MRVCEQWHELGAENVRTQFILCVPQRAIMYEIIVCIAVCICKCVCVSECVSVFVCMCPCLHACRPAGCVQLNLTQCALVKLVGGYGYGRGYPPISNRPQNSTPTHYTDRPPPSTSPMPHIYRMPAHATIANARASLHSRTNARGIRCGGRY